MSEDALNISVSWREIPILEEVSLRDLSQEAAFLVTDAPLPVGTMLILSPTEAEEIRVPARVVHGQEALSSKHAEPKTPGMQLVFEGAGELLEPYLSRAAAEEEQASAEQASAEQASAEQASEDPPDEASQASPASESGEYAEISAEPMDQEDYDVDLVVAAAAAAALEEAAAEEQEAEQRDQGAQSTTTAGAMDSAIAPQASGEIDQTLMAGARGSHDPDARDKVIVEVADPEMAVAAEEEGENFCYDDVEEVTKVENKKRKRRRKKKKKR